MPELPQLAVIEVKGKDSRSFLHDQLSADVRTLAPGESTFAALCRADGRVLALLLVWAQEDRFGIVCAAPLAEAVAAHLSQYVLRADVTLDSRGDLRVFGLSGRPDDGTTVLQPLPELRYGFRSGGGESDRGAWKAAELARGVAWLEPATSGEFLPQMLGHEHIGALSFRKGCFPGQEIIARVRYLGSLKRRPLLLRCAEPVEPEAMEPVTLLVGDTEYEAVVVDHAGEPGGDSILFAVVRAAENIEPNRMVLCGKPFDIVVARLIEAD